MKDLVTKGPRRIWVRLLCLLLLVAVGCKGSQPSPPPKAQRLVVFAASSLKDAFATMGTEFKRTHPGVELAFNFAGTQELRTQLEQGAAADVFASADQRHMDALVRAGLVSEARLLVRNEPVIVVANDSEVVIRELADLPNADRIVIGTEEVPIGRYTLQVLDRASSALGANFRTRVEAKVVSRELNVRQVLSKVSLSEAQAGIVYRTDAQTALDRVRVVTIPTEINVVADYPIGIATSSGQQQLAQAWLAFAVSAEGSNYCEPWAF